MGFNYAPYGYEEINVYAGTFTPSEIHNRDNYTYWYWFRALFQRAASTIKFDLPSNWSEETQEFFKYCLFVNGFVAIFDSNKFGLSFQPCTLYGYDFYYQPTNALITNPAITDSLDLKLHDECELIRLTPDYLGIVDIIDYYAAKLANMSCAFDMTVENSKLAYVVTGKTKSAVETIKKIFDKISKGITAIVADSRVVSNNDVEPFTWLTRDAKNSYVGSDLIQDIQSVLNMFDREIGIPTVPYQKKERMVDFESKSAIIDASSRLSTWVECLTKSIKIVNEKFSLNISFETKLDDIEDITIPTQNGGESNE